MILNMRPTQEVEKMEPAIQTPAGYVEGRVAMQSRYSTPANAVGVSSTSTRTA
jgi:hypothetical protein